LEVATDVTRTRETQSEKKETAIWRQQTFQALNQKSNPKQTLPKTAYRKTYPTICDKNQPQKMVTAKAADSPLYYLQPNLPSK
jgi:hypothetical protein